MTKLLKIWTIRALIFTRSNSLQIMNILKSRFKSSRITSCKENKNILILFPSARAMMEIKFCLAVIRKYPLIRSAITLWKKWSGPDWTTSLNLTKKELQATEEKSRWYPRILGTLLRDSKIRTKGLTLPGVLGSLPMSIFRTSTIYQDWAASLKSTSR